MGRTTQTLACISLLILLAGCSQSTPGAGPSSPTRCEQAATSTDESAAKAIAVADELRAMIAIHENALIDTRQITAQGDTAGIAILWAHGELGPAGMYSSVELWTSKQSQGITALRQGFLVMVNEPTCFTPAQVAGAQTTLEKLATLAK